MTQSIEQVLNAYGLNKKQAKFYLACLSLGMATVAEAAKKSGLKRTTIYTLLEELEPLGIIRKAVRKGRTYYTAESPENLLVNLEERLYQFKKALPQLIAKQAVPDDRPRVVFYYGREGFKKMWWDILNSGELEYLITTSAKDFETFMGEKYIIKNLIDKKIKAGVKSRQIITDSSLARKIVAKDKLEQRESKIAPPHHPFIATEIIYGHKVAVFSTRFENILMIIQSMEVAKTRRSNFELLWELLK